jgi:hypothetical protein
VFSSKRDGNTVSEIYVMNVDGSNQTRLTTTISGHYNSSPAFSPDGTRIVFDSTRDGHSEIYMMNADGSAQTRITNNSAGNFRPSFSPDGSRIVFETFRDGTTGEIYIMNADGSGQRRLTNNSVNDFAASFSPGGTHVAFVSVRDGNEEIYVMNADGSDQTRLTSNSIFDSAPNWRWPVSTPTPGAKLANISTRLRVETGDNALIGGFIVTGTQPKKVLVRAIGPSLPVNGKLADPTLALYSGPTLLETNDNWGDSANKQAIIATTIPPSNNLESAIVRTLPAEGSAYTAVVRGANNGTGVGLVEVYDLDQAVDSKLANISTRGLVQTGDNAMIGGFIVLNGNQKVIVRAIGPSLPVSGALQDPVLELHNSNGAVLQSNDNWKTGGQQAEIIATTVPPTRDEESAVVRTLAPGNYTAVVRGVNNTTGVALVEVFALQ